MSATLATEVDRAATPVSNGENGCDPLPPFEELMRRYAGMVYSTCYRVTHDVHDAEDATQAVFLTLAVEIKTGAQIRHIAAWLQQVARRLALNLRRGKNRRKKRELVHGELARDRARDCAEHNRPERGMEETKAIVAEEMEQLPTHYRLPLILHYFGGLNRDELARELSCRPATLRVRLHRARTMLVERLTKRGIDVAPMAIDATLEHFIRGAVTESIVSSAARAAANGVCPPMPNAADLFRGAATAKVKATIGATIIIATALAAAGGQTMELLGHEKLPLKLKDLGAILNWFHLPTFKSSLPAPQAVVVPRPNLPSVSGSTPPPIQYPTIPHLAVNNASVSSPSGPGYGIPANVSTSAPPSKTFANAAAHGQTHANPSSSMPGHEALAAISPAGKPATASNTEKLTASASPPGIASTPPAAASTPPDAPATPPDATSTPVDLPAVVVQATTPTVTFPGGVYIGSIGGATSDVAFAAGGQTDLAGNNYIAGSDADFGPIPSVPTATVNLINSRLYAYRTFALNPNRDIGIGPAQGTGNYTGIIDVAKNQTLTIPGDIKSMGNGGTNNLVTTPSGGKLILAGNNHYNGTTFVAGGTLQVGAGGSAGTLGSGPVVDSGTLIFDRGSDYAVANSISGAGSIDQVGSGAVTLSANNNGFTGDVEIFHGTFAVTGSVASAAHVHVAGGILAGNTSAGHTAGSVTLSKGTIDAGTASASIGTLNFASLTVQGGVLQFDLGSSNLSDLLAVSGEANFKEQSEITITTTMIGSYTLVTAQTLTGIVPTLVAPHSSQYTYNLNFDPLDHEIVLTVAGHEAEPVMQPAIFTLNSEPSSVPEPATMGALALGAMGLLARRRRKVTRTN